MKWIDLPPIWLAGFAYLTWELRSAQGHLFSGQHLLGTSLVVTGLGLMVLAVVEMQRRRTTVIPHLDPNALVSTGIFRYTRNPIYLGDALVLAGLALRWHAPLGLLLVPVFIWVINVRFVRAEEGRLRHAFGTAFDDYANVTRRWL